MTAVTFWEHWLKGNFKGGLMANRYPVGNAGKTVPTNQMKHRREHAAADMSAAQYTDMSREG